MKSVFAGPATCIEHRSGESAFGCQTHYCWLRLANIPRCRAVVVRRIPRQSRPAFVTGRVPMNGSSARVPDSSNIFVPSL